MFASRTDGLLLSCGCLRGVIGYRARLLSVEIPGSSPGGGISVGSLRPCIRPVTSVAGRSRRPTRPDDLAWRRKPSSPGSSWSPRSASWRSASRHRLQPGSRPDRPDASWPRVAVPAPLALALRVGLRDSAVLVIAPLVLPRSSAADRATPPGPPLRSWRRQSRARRRSPLVNSSDADVLSVEELTPSVPHRRRHRTVAPSLAADVRTAAASQRYLVDRTRSSSPTSAPSTPGPASVSSEPCPTVRGGSRHDARAPADGRGILLGDFNASIDHAPFRGLLGRGWDDAAATVGKGLVPTWPHDRHHFRRSTPSITSSPAT